MSYSNRQSAATCGVEDLHLKQLGVSSSSDGPRTSCRPACNFITFKGENQKQDSGLERAESQRGISQVRDHGGGIFKIVPSDIENLRSDENLSPIGPIADNNLKEFDQDNRPKEPFRFAGYLSTISASLFYSIGFLLFRLLPIEDNLQEKAKTLMIRGISMMLLCGLSMVHQDHKFKIERGEYWLNFWRSLLGACNMVLTYASLMYITLGENQTMINWSCVWTSLFGFIILREPLPLSLILAVPMSLFGIVLLARPQLILGSTNGLELTLSPTNELHQMSATLNQTLNAAALEADALEDRWPGFALAIAGSFVWTIVTIILKLRRKTPIVTCSFYFGLSQALLGLVIQLILGFGALPSTVLEWTLHASIGLSSFSFQNLFQWGLLFVPAGTYSVIRTLDIPFSFILGAIFLHELILWTSVVGSILIMLAVITLVFNDHLVRALKSLCS